MIRAAAKNYSEVTVLVDNSDYSSVIKIEEKKGTVNQDLRYKLAVKAFEHTASYEDAIANFGKHAKNNHEYFPKTFNKQFVKSKDLRYGKISSKSAFYIEKNISSKCCYFKAITRERTIL